MRVSVIIPVKDDLRIFACVDSVLACRDEAESLQVIVVDNGSTAEFHGGLGALPDPVLVVNSLGTGAYVARNQGVDRATGELILFTDADCIVRRGWIGAAVECARGKAAIVQGYSGPVSKGLLSQLIQHRYEAHLVHVRPGAATECDTRNLAVRRDVFSSLRFNELYRRVGDTEFGLLAEAAGFRVAFCPEMRADHDHEADLRLFAAKQVCHGWGAQRLMYDSPALRWHGGLMRPVSLTVERLGRLPGRRRAGEILARVTIALSGPFESHADRLPFRAAAFVLTVLDKFAGLAGHLMFAPGTPEPSPSQLVGRRLPRD